MAESVLRFKVETLDANAKIAHLTKKVRGLEVAVKNAGGSTRAAGTGFKAFAGGAQAASVGARGLSAAVGAALAPVTALVAAAASLGQVFGVLRQQDFAEAKVKSLGVNSQELKARLSDVSRELSGQASVVDLTSAAYDVASAGFTNAADAANILKAASQGATGGFSDINTVGDAATSVLNAYGLEADKASKLVDGFIQTQNDGKIVIGEYAANIAKVAPVAAALSVPLEEVNAAVAQITAGGQGAEVTFTALKTAFAQVAAGKVGKEFEAFGVEINATTLKTDGLAGTLEKIKKSGADAGTVIKAFGTEAGPSILALLNDTEKFNKLLENQKNAQGAAAKAAFTASDTIDGQLKRLTTAFQNLFSDQSELGILLKETFKVAAVTVEVLAVAISNVLSPIRAVFAAVNEVGTAIAEALGIEGLNAAFELEQGFQFVLGGVKKLGDFVIGVGVRIGQVVGGLAKLIVTSGKGALDSVTGFFRTALERIVGFIKGAYNLIPEPIRRFLEGGAAAATSFVGETVALGQGVTQGAAGEQQQAAANAIQKTNQKLGGGSAKKSGKTDLELQQEAASKLLKTLEERKTLATALTSDEQKMLQLKIDQANVDEQFPLLSAETRDNIKEQLEALYAQENVTQALKKAADDRAKEEKEVADKQAEQAKKLEDLYKNVGTAIENSIVDGIMGAIEGTQTLQETVSGLLKDIGKMLLQFAVRGLLQGTGLPLFAAEGAYVSGPTSAVVGEGGEPEYVIPESKMRESMARYSRGARGPSVIPETGGSGTSGEGGGTAVAAPIDVRYTVERINSVDYVTADQFQDGMRQAANQGAKQGEQQTLKRLQMSGSTRKRLGL